MLVLIARRLGQSALVLLVMSLLVFVGVFAIGDPLAILVSPDATPEEIARSARELGLQQPLWQQYLLFLQQALQGNLGRSFAHGEPAMALILERLPATLELAISATVIAIVAGFGADTTSADASDS